MSFFYCKFLLSVTICFLHCSNFLIAHEKFDVDNFQVNLQTALKAAQEVIVEGQRGCGKDTLTFMRHISLHDDCADSFHVVDVAVLVDRLMLWNKHMPMVTPFYAVKANSDPIIVKVLAALGLGFDCASKGEIDQVLHEDVDAARIIFANPRKPESTITFAQANKVKMMTFDSFDELHKMVEWAQDGQFVLRIKTDDAHSSNPLGAKFGASLDLACKLLDYAFSHEINIIGISFHVGSNCTHVDSYAKALYDSAFLFNYCKNKWHKKLTLLDLGGGWPGNDDESFIRIAKTVSDLIANLFEPDIQVIAEPGRYFSAKTTAIATKIIGKSFDEERQQRFYYLSQGAYGFFLSSIYYNDDKKLIESEGWCFKSLFDRPERDVLYSSKLWGPTCDSGDKVLNDVLLPEMQRGDFLYVDNAGAYTYSLQTPFNQITPSKAYYICGKSYATRFELPPKI